MECILAVDVGTASLRSVLYNLKGRLIFNSHREYKLLFNNSLSIEQDPKSWKSALISTLKDVSQYIEQQPVSILAISVTSQRASVISVDNDCNPLFNAIMWQDKRSIEQCKKLSELIGINEIYQRTGLRIDPYFSLPKMLWFKKNYPEIYNKTYKLIGVQDYILYLLTNSFVTDWTQASRTMLMNIRSFEWDSDILKITDIDSSLLPGLFPPGSIVGKLSKDIASFTGLMEGIPVIIAGGDQPSAAVGLNILKTGYASVNTGTGSFIIAFSESPVFDKKNRVLCSAASIPGKWVVEAGIFNTGSIYRWFKEEFYDLSSMEKNSYEILNKEAEKVPVGSNGIAVLPHFEGSAAPYWDPIAKGLIFNLTLGSKRSDLVRAVLEGICLEIADNILLIENVMGEITTVSVAGGLTKFSLFNQIQADAINKSVIKYQHSEASSLGAAIICAVTLGIYGTHHEAFENMTLNNMTIFNPLLENYFKYKELLRRKNHLYNALKSNKIYELFTKDF